MNSHGFAPVSDERLEEILDHLNGMVARINEGGDVGYDWDLVEMILWTRSLPEFESFLINDPYAKVTLSDGTELEWVRSEHQWTVTIPEEVA